MIKFTQFITILSVFLISLGVQAKDYGLKQGDKAPAISTKDIHGKSFELSNLLKKGKVVLVFYRGGWCPYCNLQLKQLEAKLLPEAVKQKASIVAISVDKPSEAALTEKENKLGFRVISDSEAKIIDAYNLSYNVKHLDEKYKGYGIDLAKSAGNENYIIAVPSTLVINQSGEIDYVFTDENYKVRANIDEIIEALKK